MREPEGNGCSERFIRLLKENLLWVRTFATIEELRLALIDFKHVYNEMNSGSCSVTTIRRPRRYVGKNAKSSTPRPLDDA